ncbi:hypothetical protein [Streptomyces sp. NBC_01689]|uniref:hypothetical protein n=1 Tax=Streptomyces sp. NBC_01689 TaxID=2975911 RepID=UPI002E37FEDF|nr:hypothetical protein [Streptomyces sp. NBC_01689]
MKAIRPTTLLGTLRRAARTTGDAVRSATPAALARAVAAAARTNRERIVAGPDAEEPPTAEEIAQAAEEHERARELYNRGAREKRAARKVLERAATGEYGSWSVTWVQSTRTDWDREAIAAVFAELGREIPTKPSAPTLTLTRAEQSAEFPAAA